MLSLINKKIKVAVHGGNFHPDDVFSVAILSLYLKKPLKIFRTRDKNVLSKMNYVLDVGGEYNPKENKFDHHQEGWSEKRENGIPYATSGLIWKEYGEKIAGSQEIADKIDEKIIQSIDAEDNGMEIYSNLFQGISQYTFGDYIYSFNSTWNEIKCNSLKAFMFGVEETKKLLIREIKNEKDNLLGSDIVRKIYEKTEDKKIIVLDKNYFWENELVKYEEPMLVISPRKEVGNWAVKTVPLESSKFERRFYFPKSWAGKRDNDLEKATGIYGVVFCHNGRFVVNAKSKESAIALAKLALTNYKV